MQKEVCFRCHNDLIVTDERPAITFYKCNNCNRAYAKKAGKTLTDRWQSPMTIALYVLIFEKELVSDDFINRSVKSLSHIDKPGKTLIIEDIEEELNHPKQKLVDTLGLLGTEEIARDYLARLLPELKKTIQ